MPKQNNSEKANDRVEHRIRVYVSKNSEQKKFNLVCIGRREKCGVNAVNKPKMDDANNSNITSKKLQNL